MLNYMAMMHGQMNEKKKTICQSGINQWTRVCANDLVFFILKILQNKIL